MAEKPEDLSLPVAVVSRIITDALPANTNVSTETRKAIAKAASVFVLYATANAAGIAAKHNRKTTNANDVLEAIAEMEFTQFAEPLRKSLEHYHSNMKKKKSTGSSINNKSKSDTSEANDQEQATTSNSNSTPKSNKSGKSKSKTSPPSKKSKNSSSAMEVVEISDSDDE